MNNDLDVYIHTHTLFQILPIIHRTHLLTKLIAESNQIHLQRFLEIRFVAQIKCLDGQVIVN